MFKTRPRERFIFASYKPKRHRQFSFVWVIVSLVLLTVVLELLTRIFVDVSSKGKEIPEAQQEIINSYKLKFVSENQQPDRTLRNDGFLVAQRSLSVGYQLVGNQKNKYWQINEQGFRDRDPVPLAKPSNEVRVFLLGGSTAFGYGNFSNEATISEQLEARLQQRLQQQKSSPQFYRPNVLPEEEKELKKALAKPLKIKSGNYRVINAAVPGYASGNQLAQLALQILRYKPDLVIILDGYSDLMLTGTEKAADIPQTERLSEPPTNFGGYLSQLLQPLRDKSYLVKFVQDSIFLPKSSQAQDSWLLDKKPSALAEYLPQTEAELGRRRERYLQNHKQIVTLCAGAHVPLIVAMQPEITGRNPSQLHETEGVITSELGREYIQGVKDNYAKIIAASQKLGEIFPYNLTTLNLYNLNDKYPSPSFIDPIHLTDEANKVVAEQLYYAIASLPKMQVIPQKAPPKPQTTITPKTQE
jgi:lysophospholipase L1-like esterase